MNAILGHSLDKAKLLGLLMLSRSMDISANQCYYGCDSSIMFNSGKTEPEKHRWFGNVKTTFCKHCIIFQKIQANKMRVVVDYKAGKDYLQCLQTYPKKYLLQTALANEKIIPENPQSAYGYPI
jgi:hypothetical protein